jgi:cytoskeletal protein CcmA (bactofilin family)
MQDTVVLDPSCFDSTLRRSAQDVTVSGRVKGAIRAIRVKLQNGGVIEGDIFHRSLSIDENSQFEGCSRRVENPTDLIVEH